MSKIRSIHLILMPEYGQYDDLPHLGHACLAAYLKKNGVNVTATDFRLSFNSTGLLLNYACNYEKIAYIDEIPDLPLILSLVKNYKMGRHLLYGFQDVLLNYIQHRFANYYSFKRAIEEIYGLMTRQTENIARHNIVGFTTVYSNLFATMMLSLLLRQHKPGIRIIYGGPQTTLSINSAKLILKLKIADVVVVGDGEETLLEVIKSYEAGKTPVLDGTITYNSQKDAFLIKPPKIFADLNTLPVPDFSIFQLRKYRPFSLPLYFSKGCIFKCSFCSYNKFTPFRFKNPKVLVDEMLYLNKRYNALRFEFSDSVLNISEKWLEQFADELIRCKCNLQWGGFFKPWMTDKLLEKLVRSGLYNVVIGAESFSGRILKKMGKGNTNTNTIIRAIESFCSAGINVTVGLIAGFPGELKTDFTYTYKQVLRLNEKYPNNFIINPQVFQLRPSSRCYGKHREFGIIVKKWNRKVSDAMPEVSDIVKNIPVAFSREKPSNLESRHRYDMLENINRPLEINISSLRKTFLNECLKHVKGSSIISATASSRESVYLPATGKSRKTFCVLKYQSKRVVLSGKEELIFKSLDSHNSLSKISDIVSKEYREDKKKSYKFILQFLRYLIDNIHIKIIRQ